MPRIAALSWSFAAVTIVAAGCTSEARQRIRFPNFFHPGPAAVQRAEAVDHDPYPLNDIGPAIVGGRPLGYLQPVPEEKRMTMNATPPPGVAPTIVPGAPMRGPVVVPYPTPPTYPVSTFPVTPAVPPPGPPPVVTTPIPPPAPVQSTPFIRQQRSPY